MFLTEEDLATLTGRARAKEQIEWLRQRRYPFEIGADGKPKVLRSFVNAKLGGGAVTPDSGPKLRLAG